MELNNRLDFLLKFISSNANKALEHFNNGNNDNHSKNDGSLVTELDVFLNKKFISEISIKYPGEGVLGEEISLKKNSNFQWVIDPIDGTDAFVMGSANWTISVGLLDDGAPVLGVVANPILNRILFAFKGGGAFKTKITNYQKCDQIFISDTRSISDAKIFGLYDKNALYAPSAFIKDIIKDAKYYLDFYSFSEHCSYLAMGKADAVIFWWDTLYDIAPLKIIIEEAGGKVTDLFGEDQRYDCPIKGAILSNGHLHGFLVEKLNSELHK
ncbi:MAG: inositol monophosphatase [Candidatus Paceibacterota bacterium]|nr:MAG: inositol monophosphatase [Candidatus Paceibacterota bacterium]